MTPKMGQANVWSFGLALFRSYLKKVFLPNLCVRLSFQVLDILEYACGLKLGPALTLSQNPFFEMASSNAGSYFDVIFSP
jgi:hypothetical protein